METGRLCAASSNCPLCGLSAFRAFDRVASRPSGRRPVGAHRSSVLPLQVAFLVLAQLLPCRCAPTRLTRPRSTLTLRSVKCASTGCALGASPQATPCRCSPSPGEASLLGNLEQGCTCRRLTYTNIRDYPDPGTWSAVDRCPQFRGRVRVGCRARRSRDESPWSLHTEDPADDDHLHVASGPQSHPPHGTIGSTILRVCVRKSPARSHVS